MTFFHPLFYFWVVLCIATTCTPKEHSSSTPQNTRSHTVAVADENWLQQQFRPSYLVLPDLPADTLGVRSLLDSCKYYRDTAHLDLLKDAQWTSRVASLYCNARMYKKAYGALYYFALNEPQRDTAALIVPLIEHYAQRIAYESQSDAIAGKLLYLCGFVLQKQGDYDQANTYYWNALQWLPKEQYLSDWVKMLGNIAQNYNSQGDYKQSVHFSQLILNLLNKYKDEISEVNYSTNASDAYRYLGWAAYESNNNIQAIHYFHQSLNYIDSDDSEMRSDRHVFLSKSYLELNNIDSALYHVQLALRLAKQYDPTKYPVDLMHQLARCNLRQGQLDAAKQLFQEELPHALEALGAKHPDCFKIYAYLGEVFEKEGQLDSALWAYNAVLRIFDGQVDHQNNPRWDKLPKDHWVLEALTKRADLLEQAALQQGDTVLLRKAVACTQMATQTQVALFKVFENEQHKTDFSQNIRPLFQGAIQRALALGDLDQAYRFMQSGKAALLREKMAQNRSFDAIPDTLKQQWHTLQSQINEQNPNSGTSGVTAQLTIQLKALEQRIGAVSPQFAQLSSMTTVLPIADMQRKLDKQTAILDYFWADTVLYLFVVTQQQLKCHTLTLGDSVLAQINALRYPSGGEQCAQYNSTAHSVYQHLLAAGLSGMQGINRLWLVPDQALHYLPFGALLTQPSEACGKEAPYLLRQYALTHAFTAAQFFTKASTEPFVLPYGGWGMQYDSVVLLASNDRQAFRGHGYLPKAAIEIQKAHAIMGGNMWLNEQVSKANFLAHIGQCATAHLAMHALVDTVGYLEPCLAFAAPGTRMDSAQDWVTLREITGLRLQNELVVLSACNTGNGALVPSEGVANLGRAFQYAGAKSVLMTHWQAEDNASEAIVSRFFEGLGQGENKDEALRQAQLAFLDNPAYATLQAPVYWANFVLSGDPSALHEKGSKWPAVACFLLAALVGLVFWKGRKTKVSL